METLFPRSVSSTSLLPSAEESGAGPVEGPWAGSPRAGPGQHFVTSFLGMMNTPFPSGAGRRWAGRTQHALLLPRSVHPHDIYNRFLQTGLFLSLNLPPAAFTVAVVIMYFGNDH